MKFRLWTMLWMFALLASALATFGGGWPIPFFAVAGFWLLAFNRAQIGSLGCLFMVASRTKP